MFVSQVSDGYAWETSAARSDEKYMTYITANCISKFTEETLIRKLSKSLLGRSEMKVTHRHKKMLDLKAFIPSLVT